MTVNVTILGDSRTFDTYFTNSNYATRYGYEKTFPLVWRKMALVNAPGEYDVVHISDHFRGGTVQNNIVRLAQSNPVVVVILDGIWDTLIGKKNFLEYAEQRQQAPSPKTGESLESDYDPATLSRLFVAGELSISPQNFAHRARRIISYIRRRQRQII